MEKKVLESINTKSSRNFLTTFNLKMTKVNSQTKMTESIIQKMTIPNLECNGRPARYRLYGGSSPPETRVRLLINYSWQHFYP